MSDKQTTPTLNTLLEPVRQAQQAIREPLITELEALAQDRLEPGRKAELEILLTLRPDLRLAVEAMHRPDPLLQAAISRGIAEGLKRLNRPTVWQWLLDGLGLSRSWVPVGTAGLAMAMLALLLVRAPLLRDGGLVGLGSGQSARESVFTLGTIGQTRAMVGQEPLQLLPGEYLFLDLDIKPPFKQALVLELSDLEVRLWHEQPVPQRESLQFIMKAGPGVQYLARVYLEKLVPGEQVRSRLETEVKAQRLTTAQGAPLRKALILKTVKEISGGAVAVDLSKTYETGGL